MADIISIVNAIHASGSADYQKYVPLATATNIDSVANPIMTYEPVKNEFITTMLNKIVMTVLHTKILNIPLAPLKRGTMMMGNTVEEMFINRAKATTHDPDGSTLLTRTKPDVKVAYHSINREDTYPISISDDQLTKAFKSYEALRSMINGIIRALYNADADDEFMLMKSLMSDAVAASHVVTSEVPDWIDADGKPVEELLKRIVGEFKNVSSYMTFAGSSFNKWAEVNTDAEPIRTRTDRKDQVLIIRSDLKNAIDLNVLAAAFNLDKADFLARQVEVDNFGSDSDIVAFICDKEFFQVYDKLRKITSFMNPQGLYTNYYLHVWQVLSYSLMVNAVAFKLPVETP